MFLEQIQCLHLPPQVIKICQLHQQYLHFHYHQSVPHHLNLHYYLYVHYHLNLHLSPPPPPPDMSAEDTPKQSMDLMDDTIDYYIIEPAAPEPHPRAPQVETTPIQCYDRDVILEQDVENGWEKPEINETPDQGPFIGTPGLNLKTKSRKPEDFFNNFFDN